MLGLIFNVGLLLLTLWVFVQPLAWLMHSPVLACEGYGDGGCVNSGTTHPALVWICLAALSIVVWGASGWVRGACSTESKAFAVFNGIYLHLRVVVLALVGLAATMFVLLVALPFLVEQTPHWLERASHWSTAGAVVGALGALAAAARTLVKPLTRFAPQIGGFLLVAVVVLLVAGWASRADTSPTWEWYVAVGGWFLASWALVPDWWSMAPFYRGKLRGAFATFRDRGQTSSYRNGNTPTATAEPSLAELHRRSPTEMTGTPLTICATATVSGRRVKTHYGIPALSVTFDPETTQLNIPVDDEGAWSAYRCPTARLERLLYRGGGSRFTTMMAVGISGAALAPAMGKFHIGPARALLALTNIRLGIWVPNPKYVASWRPGEPVDRTRPRRAFRAPYPRPRLSYLIKETLGIHDPDDLYLYLTDGGHWENTGLVELVRDRNLSEVVCLDADAGPRNTVAQLAQAIGLARQECAAHIDVSLDPLRAPAEAGPGSAYARRSVTVGLIRRGPHRCLLWYAKPVLTAETPPEILSYGEVDAAFPTTSTVDQFFHTAQFTAYRDLGRDNASQLIAARTALRTALRDSPSRAAFVAAAKVEGAHWALATLAALVGRDGPLSPDEDYAAIREQVL